MTALAAAIDIAAASTAAVAESVNLTLYPPLAFFVLASQYLLSGVPLLVSLCVIASYLTGLSTGFMLPLVNRQLHDWLYR